METITFYSYKGGSGRTLLVANVARYLASLGKRVVAIDSPVEEIRKILMKARNPSGQTG